MIYDSRSLNSITGQIIGLAIKVHRLMGPGLLESVYLTCLCYELKKAGLIVEREKMVPLFYEGVRLDQSYRLAPRLLSALCGSAVNPPRQLTNAPLPLLEPPSYIQTVLLASRTYSESQVLIIHFIFFSMGNISDF